MLAGFFLFPIYQLKLNVIQRLSIILVYKNMEDLLIALGGFFLLVVCLKLPQWVANKTGKTIRIRGTLSIILHIHQISSRQRQNN